MNVIKFMENEKYEYRRLAYTLLPMVADPQGIELIMATNHFKKEMKKSNAFEISATLNALANTYSAGMAHQLSDDVMTLHNNIAKPVVRKKTAAIMAKTFQLSPESIPVHLENVIKRISTETNTSNTLYFP